VVFPVRTLALIVLGSTGVSAWGQVDAPGASAGTSVPGGTTTSAPVPTPTAVATFPDVVEAHPHRTRAPTHELLDGNPYGNELVPLKGQENLFGLSIDDENPYAEQMRFANPYTLELRLKGPYPEGSASRRDAPSNDRDFENPYGQATALMARPALEPDFENPYAR
jgi:hypothetical protein